MQNFRIFLIGEEKSFDIKSLITRHQRGRHPPNPPFDFSIDTQRTVLSENTVLNVGKFIVNGSNICKIRANKTIILSVENNPFTALEKAIKLN